MWKLRARVPHQGGDCEFPAAESSWWVFCSFSVFGWFIGFFLFKGGFMALGFGSRIREMVDWKKADFFSVKREHGA